VEKKNQKDKKNKRRKISIFLCQPSSNVLFLSLFARFSPEQLAPSDRCSRAHCQFPECHHELFCYRSRLSAAYYSAVDFGDGSNLCCSASDEDLVSSVKVEKAQISLNDLNPILLRQLEDRLSGYPFQVI